MLNSLEILYICSICSFQNHYYGDAFVSPCIFSSITMQLTGAAGAHENKSTPQEFDARRAIYQ